MEISTLGIGRTIASGVKANKLTEVEKSTLESGRIILNKAKGSSMPKMDSFMWRLTLRAIWSAGRRLMKRIYNC